MKLADLATGSDWIVWIVFVIFAALSITLLSGHGSWFISGYNTATKEEKESIHMQIGKITQVMGPVVDVHFDETPLPYIQTALQVDNHGKKVVMEVMQHIGTDTVRCIMLSPSEGLQKDMPVLSTGMGIEIPVGTQNVLSLISKSQDEALRHFTLFLRHWLYSDQTASVHDFTDFRRLRHA